MAAGGRQPDAAPFRRYPERTWFHDERYRFLYAPVPKAACSTVKALSYRLRCLEQPALPAFLERDFGGRSFHLFMDHDYSLAAMTDEAARAVLADPGVFRFTFVRNPLDRIASAWLNKFVTERYNTEQWEHTMPVMQAVHGEGARPMFDSVSFERFVDYLGATPDEQLDKHWCPQVRFLAAGPEFDG